MMENYFNVFKAQNVYIDTNRPEAKRIEDSDRTVLISAINSASKYPLPSAVVSISTEATNLSFLYKVPVEPDLSVFEPSDGVMVKKESISYLNQYEGMDKRISMVEVNNKTSMPDSDALAGILSNIENQKINIAEILSQAGAFNSKGEEISIKGRVELGAFRGGDFMFDFNGNIIGQKIIGNGGVDRVANETSSKISMTTSNGATVYIGLTVKDQMNAQGTHGAARDIELTFSTSEELTEDEITALNAVLKDMSTLATSFQENFSVQESDLNALASSISKHEGIFNYFSGSFELDRGEMERKISLNMNESKNLTVSIKEKGMVEAFETSAGNNGYLQIHMGDISTESQFKDHNDLSTSIRRDQVDLYNSAVLKGEAENQYMHSKYMASFLSP